MTSHDTLASKRVYIDYQRRLHELQPFEIAGSEMESTIAIDSSTRDNTTVTIAVELQNRANEFELIDELSAIARHQNVTEFKLFSNKANDLSRGEYTGFFDEILDSWSENVRGYRHRSYGAESQHDIEALHSVFLIDDLLDRFEDRVVIVDGSRQKADPVVSALNKLRHDVPTIVHCPKSELYYPQSLLADLLASHLSYRCQSATYSNDSVPMELPFANHVKGEWGTAFSALKSGGKKYRPLKTSILRGETPAERVQCWYHGNIPRNSAERPVTDSLAPIIKQADAYGFDSAKAELERLR